MIGALGGAERIFNQHPYWRLTIFHNAQLETYSIACSYMAIMKPKLASRKAVENLTNDWPEDEGVQSLSPPVHLGALGYRGHGVSILTDNAALDTKPSERVNNILSNTMLF